MGRQAGRSCSGAATDKRQPAPRRLGQERVACASARKGAAPSTKEGRRREGGRLGSCPCGGPAACGDGPLAGAAPARPPGPAGHGRHPRRGHDQERGRVRQRERGRVRTTQGGRRVGVVIPENPEKYIDTFLFMSSSSESARLRPDLHAGLHAALQSRMRTCVRTCVSRVRTCVRLCAADPAAPTPLRPLRISSLANGGCPRRNETAPGQVEAVSRPSTCPHPRPGASRHGHPPKLLRGPAFPLPGANRPSPSS